MAKNNDRQKTCYLWQKQWQFVRKMNFMIVKWISWFFGKSWTGQHHDFPHKCSLQRLVLKDHSLDECRGMFGEHHDNECWCYLHCTHDKVWSRTSHWRCSVHRPSTETKTGLIRTCYFTIFLFNNNQDNTVFWATFIPLNFRPCADKSFFVQSSNQNCWSFACKIKGINGPTNIWRPP